MRDPGARKIIGIAGVTVVMLAAVGFSACSGPGAGGPNCHDTCLAYEQICGPEGVPQACTGPDPDGCFGWMTLPACPSGQSCTAGACVCDPSCQLGQTICGPTGGLVTCDGRDDKGCLAWGGEQACPVDQSCRAGACVCDDPCQPGDALCGPTDGLIVCSGPDEAGCTGWAPEQACPTGQLCSEGACECVEACQPGQRRCGPDGGVTTCQDPQSGQDCARFGPEQACPVGQECLGGECACAEPCVEGETFCAAGGVSTCQRAEPSGCLAWSEAAVCPGNQVCIEGRCVCMDTCELGQTLCADDGRGLFDCEMDELDCFGWGDRVDCDTGLVCNPKEGLCRPDTPPECYDVNECRYKGEKICMTDVKYRECKVGYDGCLTWDCST